MIRLRVIFESLFVHLFSILRVTSSDTFVVRRVTVFRKCVGTEGYSDLLRRNLRSITTNSLSVQVR
jgi:hypothetical protein